MYTVIENCPTADGNNDFHQELYLKGKIIAFEYAKGGHPNNGCAYWKYYAVKYKGNLYIVEYAPVENSDDCSVVTKRIDY